MWIEMGDGGLINSDRVTVFKIVSEKVSPEVTIHTLDAIGVGGGGVENLGDRTVLDGVDQEAAKSVLRQLSLAIKKGKQFFSVDEAFEAFMAYP